MEEPTKVYKALAEKDGKLVSVLGADWSGGTALDLEYKEGTITYAPRDTMGIFVGDSLEHGIGQAKGNGQTKKLHGYTLVVHEAIPLGERICRVDGQEYTEKIRYPAILLGKEVWREEPARPEPKFKVGDKVRLLDVSSGTSLEAGAILTIKDWAWRDSGYYSYHVVDYTWVFKESWLEPAPVEEWVDVTKKCKVTWRVSGYVDIWHGTHLVACSGDKTTLSYVYPADCYRLELRPDSGWGRMVIWHKVTK